MHSPQLDNYEAEIVLDIPEQFDLSRYKKSSKISSRPSGASPPQQVPVVNNSNYVYRPANIPTENPSYLINTNIDMFTPHYNTLLNPHDPNNHFNNYQTMQPKAKSTGSSDMLSNNSHPQQQFVQYQSGYHAFQPILSHQQTKQQIQPQAQAQQQAQQSQQHYIYPQQQQPQLNYYPKTEFEALQISPYPTGPNSSSTLKKKNSSIQKYLPDPSYHEQPLEIKTRQHVSSSKSPRPDSGRKKNSFDDDEENDDPFKKKEYFLKGGEELKPGGSSSLASGSSTLNRIHNPIPDHSTSTMPKSSLKSGGKKPGVTFDEKLEVYEVKNPHYGLDVKSEKREMKKKKKDKLKEEEIVIKTKLDLKAKIQSQNMIHYYFYEKTLVYNALVFYEENFYRNSIVKLQEKLRTSKPDEKLRDQLIQSIEKDNQCTIDIIKHVKKDYLSKLEPFLNQYQTTVDKLHTIPGMYQVIQNAANSVNYSDIINYYVSKDLSGSPSGFRKILGHEARIDKFLVNNQSIQIKPPIQRKADLYMPKFLTHAIDSHVRDICFVNYKNLTEIIYKLNEACDTDLNTVRAIYKYILTTQLEPLRRNDTGSLLIRNYELGIESTNTIFSRLCSFAGIENHLIRGLWKTICQEPGEKIETKTVWNIVNLDCGWRFVQPNNTPIKYYFRRPDIGYEETEFYFLSDSESLFYEFLPNDKQWHFNELPANLKEYMKEFEKKPIVTPQFRTLNLSIINMNYKTANIGKEPFKLNLKYPAEYADTINFKYILKPVSSVSFSSSNQYRNQSLLANDHLINYDLNLFVIAELNSDENSILFKISALPEIGNYNLTIYASVMDDSQAYSPLQPVPIQNQDCKAILSFKINCSKVSPFEIPPNRISDINVFGMNLIMKRLGLTCCDFKQGILGTDKEGKLNIVFEMSQPLDIEAYLYSSDQSINSKFLELCILKRVVHNFLILIINPPHVGLYGLDLHGAPKGTSNSILHSQLPPIGKYLIKCHYQMKSLCQFPRGDNRQWGPKQRFYDLGMHTVGNIDPYIVNEDGKQVEIEIAMLKPVTLWYRFDCEHKGTLKEVNHYCFMNYKSSKSSGSTTKTVSFLLRFPDQGFYHLAIMANDDIFPNNPDEIVYNYLIKVQDPSNDVEPFPAILDPILWRDCCLIAPKNYRLNTFDPHFSILVPKTNQVEITNGERCLGKLEPREIENSWVGQVNVNDQYSKFVYIEAEFENRFKRLVRFKK